MLMKKRYETIALKNICNHSLIIAIIIARDRKQGFGRCVGDNCRIKKEKRRRNEKVVRVVYVWFQSQSY